MVVMNTAKAPRALLLGSVPVPDTETCFRKCQEWLPSQLDSIPDGETGSRQYFIVWQMQIWKDFPHILMPFTGQDILRVPRAEHDAHDEKLQEMLVRERPLQVMYDTCAIESYLKFKELRNEQKVLNPNLRFQVSLPTPTNFIGCLIWPKHRTQVEPYYQEGLIAALNNIQNNIPAEDLTIQIDMAADTAMFEGVTSPWWDLDDKDVFEGVMSRAAILPRLVKPDVWLGFHLCYGDIGHEHFQQPKDLSLLVKVAIALMKCCGRQINYFHFPVPIDRDDDAYLAALADFERAKSELGQDPLLYLGLVHANDPDGTKRRIATAQKVVKGPFGLATECGLGRTPPEDLESIFDIIRSNTESSSQ